MEGWIRPMGLVFATCCLWTKHVLKESYVGRKMSNTHQPARRALGLPSVAVSSRVFIKQNYLVFVRLASLWGPGCLCWYSTEEFQVTPLLGTHRKFLSVTCTVYKAFKCLDLIILKILPYSFLENLIDIP